jgi:hypothetical protein
MSMSGALYREFDPAASRGIALSRYLWDVRQAADAVLDFVAGIDQKTSRKRSKSE